MPSLLHCDVESTIAPKMRILEAVIGGLGDEGLANLVCSNPTLLAYSREKYGRLLFQFQCQAPVSLTAAEVRQTLMLDTDISSWLARRDASAAYIYEAWLKRRLQSVDPSVRNRSTIRTRANSNINKNEASGVVKEDGFTEGLSSGVLGSIAKLEKRHGGALEEIDSALARN